MVRKSTKIMKCLIQKTFLSHILAVIILITSSGVYALTAESQAKKARATEGKTVIRCSPDGKNGTYTPDSMAAEIKDGTTLVLMPGVYKQPITIYRSKVIITSEKPDRCFANISVYGKDCIVKNIYLNYLAIYRNITITDSIINTLYIKNNINMPKNGKLYLYAYNTAFHQIYTHYTVQLYANLSHSVINGTINWNRNQRALMEKSILYSKGKLISISNYARQKGGRLGIKDCMVYADTYGTTKTTNQDIKYARTFKELTRIWNVVPMGELINQKPIFIGKSPFLAENSPGRGIGLIPEEHPFYEYFKNLAIQSSSKKPSTATAKKMPPIPRKVPPQKPLQPKKQEKKTTKEENSPIDCIPQPPEL